MTDKTIDITISSGIVYPSNVEKVNNIVSVEVGKSYLFVLHPDVIINGGFIGKVSGKVDSFDGMPYVELDDLHWVDNSIAGETNRLHDGVIIPADGIIPTIDNSLKSGEFATVVPGKCSKMAPLGAVTKVLPWEFPHNPVCFKSDKSDKPKNPSKWCFKTIKKPII